MKLTHWGILALSILLPTAALADFQYQETTQITGGSLLGLMKMAGAFSRQARQTGAPIVSTVYVQGNRMARVSAQSEEIIDLDRETITTIDLDKRTYTEMTFAQMRERMQQISQSATQQQSPNQANVEFKVNVKNTGATRQISGRNATESILTMQMVSTDAASAQQGALAITNDMWLAQDVPGYSELLEFNKKLAAKMGDLYRNVGAAGPFAAMQPGMKQGMADMAKQVSQMKGIPVEQVMRMGMTTNGEPLPAASEAPLPEGSSAPNPQGEQSQISAAPSAGEVAKQSAASAIESRLGGFGFGGFGRKKKQSPAPDNQSANADASPTATKAPQAQAANVLMESKTAMTSFSSAPIDSAKFTVPAGFTQVQLPQAR